MRRPTEQELWTAYVKAFGQRIIKEASKDGEAKEG
jgi:hypothetical protein